jgi:hypothetical protein
LRHSANSAESEIFSGPFAAAAQKIVAMGNSLRGAVAFAAGNREIAQAG